MAKIEKVDLSLEDIKSVIEVQKTPIDIANNIKTYASSEGHTLDTSQMMINALNSLETFVQAISKYETSVPGNALSGASLGANILKGKEDIIKYGNVTNGTLNSILADVSSLTTNVKNPYVMAIGFTVSTTFSVASFLSTDGDTSMADSVVSGYKTVSSISNELISFSNENNISIDSLIDKSLSIFRKESEPTVLEEISVVENRENNSNNNTNNNGNISYKDSEKEQREKRGREEREFLEKQEAEEKEIYWGGVINTAVGQIGSIVTANNNFSNIEKLAVNTSFSTLGDFAEYKYGGSENGFNTTDTALNNLKGAVVSFAISSFFAKNDTLGDILGMDGTFVGDFADFTVSAGLGYATGMYIVSDFNTATTWANMNKVGTNGLTSLQAFSVGAVGGYLGNAFANKVMGWDTKEEALGASIGSAVGTTAIMAMQAELIAGLLAAGPVGWIAAVFVAFGGSAIGNVIGGIIGGLFGGSKPPPPKAHAEYEFDEDSLSYNLISSGSSDGGNEKAMIDIGKSLAKHLENMFNIPGGQLVNSDFLPDIKVNQKDKTVKINGERGTFDTVSDMLGNVLIQNIPFINVENGDPYILRAINRTNEAFLETDIHSTNRANLEELYENISLASDYSKYKSETVVLVDKNGNLITDTTKLLEINTLFQAIQNIQDEKEKEKALKEFLEEYNFITQKDYVDKLLKENNPEKQDEIDHWKKVFEKVEELQLDTHHYSEDFNKLNSEISKYNYEQSELKGLNNTNYKNNKIFKKVS